MKPAIKRCDDLARPLLPLASRIRIAFPGLICEVRVAH